MNRIFAKMIALLVWVATGLGAVSWSPPEVVGSSYSDYGAVAVDSQGNAVAVFEHYVSDSQVCVQASSKKVGQNWSTPVTLSDVVDITSQSLFPSVCVDSHGNAVAIWNVLSGTKQLIQAASLPAGSDSWIPADDNLSAHPVDICCPACLGIDGKDNALAAWMSTADDGSSFIQAARLKPGSSSWISLETLHLPNWSSFFSMGVDAKGMMHCVWLERVKQRKNCYFSFDTVQVATLASHSNTWTTQNTLSQGKCVDDAAIYVDAKGNAIATWTHLNVAQGTWNFEIFRKKAGKSRWVKTNFNTTAVDDEPDSFVAFDTAGNALFVWEPKDKKSYGPLLSAELPITNHAWTNPKIALPLNEVVQYGAGMGSDRAGNVLFVWVNPKEHLLKFATHSAVSNANWSTPGTIAPIKEFDVLSGIPECAFSSNGSVMVIYPEVTDSSSIVNSVTGTAVFQKGGR